MSTTEQRASYATDADRALKSKHRALWALATTGRRCELIPELGPELVQACGFGRTPRLDVAAGPGNAAIPAAARRDRDSE